MGATSDAGPTILQLKIRLIGVAKPPVWRRLLVPAEIRLDRFHEVIQAAMGWTDTHMHVFSTESAEYGLADSELGHRDERQVTLVRLLAAPGDRIRYTYDFGDDWEHEILLEKMLARGPDERYPSCVAGRSACPPEDCGGVWGYADLRDVLADPTHAEHEEMMDWLGLETPAEFDPAAFSVDEANKALAFIGAIR